MAFKMTKPPYADKHTAGKNQDKVAKAKQKKYNALENMKNKTPEQDAEMKNLGAWLDNYYKDDNRG